MMDQVDIEYLKNPPDGGNRYLGSEYSRKQMIAAAAEIERLSAKPVGVNVGVETRVQIAARLLRAFPDLTQLDAECAAEGAFPECLSPPAAGVKVGAEIRPGDLVNYDGDERLVRRYVGKCRRGLDVVETLHGMASFTTWISGKARLHQSPSEVGVKVGVNGSTPEAPATTSAP